MQRVRKRRARLPTRAPLSRRMALNWSSLCCLREAAAWASSNVERKGYIGLLPSLLASVLLRVAVLHMANHAICEATTRTKRPHDDVIALQKRANLAANVYARRCIDWFASPRDDDLVHGSMPSTTSVCPPAFSHG
jgi:hypothetical protein